MPYVRGGDFIPDQLYDDWRYQQYLLGAATDTFISAAGQVAAVGLSSYLGKRQRGANMPKSSYGMNSTMSEATTAQVGGENVQYIAAVRNTDSRYGKKRRKNLRNAWFELLKSRQVTKSRIQAFATNGFAEAIGPFDLRYNNVPTVNAILPVTIFRLTSFPVAKQANGTSVWQQFQPMCAYRLQRSVEGATDAKYTWNNLNAAGFWPNRGTDTIANTWDVFQTNGGDMRTPENPTALKGFRHDWTSVKMTMYPQTQLPCEFIVRLVKFKPELPDWPASDGYRAPATVESIYSDVGGAAGERISETTMMYDSYFGGKILHPHNTQSVAKSPNGKLPFKILREERFYLPAREQTNPEAPTRLLHKFFFRNDRHYNTRQSKNIRNQNLQTLANFNYIDENKTSFNASADCSPFVSPEDEVWLWVEAVSFKRFETTASDPSQGAPNVPSFDIMMINSHSYTEGDTDGYDPQQTGPLAPASITEEPKETTEV